jgi:hypothetical protein
MHTHHIETQGGLTLGASGGKFFNAGPWKKIKAARILNQKGVPGSMHTGRRQKPPSHLFLWNAQAMQRFEPTLRHTHNYTC